MQSITLSRAFKETVNFSMPLIGFRTVAINSFVAMLLIAKLGQVEFDEALL